MVVVVVLWMQAKGVQPDLNDPRKAAFQRVQESPITKYVKDRFDELECAACHKPRLVYYVPLPDAAWDMLKESELMEWYREADSYMCGAPLPDAPPHLAQLAERFAVKMRLDCESPLERYLFGLSTTSAWTRCWYCGAHDAHLPAPGDADYVFGYRQVFPRCEECRVEGLPYAVWGRRMDQERQRAGARKRRLSTTGGGRRKKGSLPSSEPEDQREEEEEERGVEYEVDDDNGEEGMCFVGQGEEEEEKEEEEEEEEEKELQHEEGVEEEASLGMTGTNLCGRASFEALLKACEFAREGDGLY